MSGLLVLLCSWLGLVSIVQAGQGRTVIAHRGASAYLPEHTLAAKALAYGMGADYLEQDIVLSNDDVPIVVHDIHLDTVTDVAYRFPERARADGRFYAIDFSLAEIKQLQLHERIRLKTGKPVFTGRFPLGRSVFRVPTLAEEIELIQGLNHSTGRKVGLYPEIKAPAWHRRQGKDISRIVLATLAEYGYAEAGSALYLQCFDAAELRRIRHELGSRLKLIQLIGERDWGEAFAATDYRRMRTRPGLQAVARYADGIGPWLKHLVRGRDAKGRLRNTGLAADARTLGLTIHPYTLRADDLPDFVDSFEELLHHLYFEQGVDGVFTDFPDRVVEFLRKQGLHQAAPSGANTPSKARLWPAPQRATTTGNGP